MAELKALADAVLGILDHANETSNNLAGPTMAQYGLLGVTGVNDAEQLKLLNQVIDIQGLSDVDTISEIQAYVNAVTALMNAAAGNGSEVTLAQLQLLEIGGIDGNNLASVQAAIAATNDDGSEVDSLAELRLLVETPATNLSLRSPDGSANNIQLIKPIVTQQGKLYYYVDYSRDGTVTGADYFTHNILDSWFNSGSNTVSSQPEGAVAGVNDMRTVIIDGYTLVLPTLEELTLLQSEALSTTEMGWDGSYHYWTATLGVSNDYHYFAYTDGSSGGAQYSDTNTAKVALQVLQNTIIEDTGGTDLLNGTNLSEVINGLSGNDTIYANGGSDMINAGSGDDAIHINGDNITHLDDAIIDGGADTDTLYLVGESLTLDFSTLASEHVQNVEVIDMTGSGDNILKLQASDVLDMSSTTDVLKVIANSGDTVHAIDMHDTGMSRTENGVTYKVYAESGVAIELWVDENATVVL